MQGRDCLLTALVNMVPLLSVYNIEVAWLFKCRYSSTRIYGVIIKDNLLIFNYFDHINRIKLFSTQFY